MKLSAFFILGNVLCKSCISSAFICTSPSTLADKRSWRSHALARRISGPTHTGRWSSREIRPDRRAAIADGEEADASQGPLWASRDADVERICVLGGGFGGLYTALKLQKMPWRGRKPKVILVDKRDKFAFLPLLYEFAVGSAELDEVAPSFRDLLAGSDVTFVQACVTGIDLKGATVAIKGAVADDLDGFMISDDEDASRLLDFDKLVLAVGAEPASIMQKVPGAEDRAIPFYSIKDSYRVKQAIRELKTREQGTRTARVVIVGGSYAGVELACNLATELCAKNVEVALVTSSEILSSASPSNREAGLRRLEEAGVRILKGARVSEVEDCGDVVLQESKGGGGELEKLPSDLLIWTAGTQPSSVIASLDAPKDSRGRVQVNRRLQVACPNDSTERTSKMADVYCLGDIAAVDGLDLPCNAQVALQQSDYVAFNIWAGSTQRRPLEFRFVHLGEMMNLGGLNGSVTTLGGRIKLTGKAAGLARRAVYAWSLD